MHVFVRLVLVSVLCSSVARADVVVFDRGGGDARTATARVVAGQIGEIVLTAAESAELDAAYAGGCVDVECCSRAGAAGSVQTVVLVEPATVTLIDVEKATSRTRPATTNELATVLARLREPLRWGTLDVSALPAGSQVVVNGAAYNGADLAPGETAVLVRDADGVEHALRVVVGGGQPALLQLPPPTVQAPQVSTTPAVNAVPLLATGGAVTVAGLTVGLIAEVLAQRAVTDLQAGRAANLRAIETVEVAAFVAAGVGVVGLGGALLLLGSTADTDASTPMPDSP